MPVIATVFLNWFNRQEWTIIYIYDDETDKKTLLSLQGHWLEGHNCHVTAMRRLNALILPQVLSYYTVKFGYDEFKATSEICSLYVHYSLKTL